MFVIGLKAADSIGVYTSEAFSSKLGGVAFGAPAWLLRNSIGRGANAITEQKWYRNTEQTKIAGFALRNLRLREVAGGSFDARSARGPVGALGLGQGLGKAREKGFLGDVEHDAKKVEERAEKYKLGEYAAHKEQADYEKTYADNHGGEKFDDKIVRLTNAIKLNKKAIETQTGVLRKEKKGSLSYKKQQDILKAMKDDLAEDTETKKKMLEHGIHTISERNSATMKAFAKRVSSPDITNYFLPSPGAKVGAARVSKESDDHGHGGAHGGHDGHNDHGPSWITAPKSGGIFGGGGGGGGDHGGGGHH
jgi:hypothetical protein